MHPSGQHPEPTTKWCILCADWRPAHETVCRKCNTPLIERNLLTKPVSDWSDVSADPHPR